MTKREIVKRIAEDLDIDQTLTKKVVQRGLDSIIDVLIDTGRIELRNFGVFEIKKRAARKARNPRTNEEVLVPARKVVAFQPGKRIIARLQNAPEPPEAMEA